MRPPDHAEPWHLPPEPDLAAALILLEQATARVPKHLTSIHAALRIAETGLQAALLQPELSAESD